jgi:hypothetical protein
MALGLNDTRPKTRGGNQSGNFGATQIINNHYTKPIINLKKASYFSNNASLSKHY